LQKVGYDSLFQRCMAKEKWSEMGIESVSILLTFAVEADTLCD